MVFGKYWMKNMKVSSKESKKQQMGLGNFHMRNYPAPYRIVFVVNALVSSFQERCLRKIHLILRNHQLT